MSTTAPTFTETSVVFAPQQLALAATARATLDLRSAFGAYLLAKIGRTAATAITGTTEAGVNVIVRPVWNNDTAVVGGVHPTNSGPGLSSIVAANSTTLNGAVSANATSAVVTSATGLAAGDQVLMTDTATAFTRAEFARISKVSGTTVTFDRPLQLAHNSGDLFTNKADIFARYWVPGGELMEIIMDFGDDAGPTNGVCISCHANVYTLDTTT